MYDIIHVHVYLILLLHALCYLDAENRKHIKELKLTVARLETMLTMLDFLTVNL